MNKRFKIRLENEADKYRYLCVLLAVLGGSSAMAADTNEPPMTPQQYFEGGTNSYNNWVELGTGGFLTRGDQTQAEAIQNWNSGAFGGIEGLHLQENVFTNTTLTLDGNYIYDQHDYDIKARLEHPDKWYLQFHANNYRTWSDDIGGFYPPTAMQYYGPNGNNILALDRGEYSVLGGITLDGLPTITIQYTHRYRDGNEDSTIWAPTHPDQLGSPATVRGLAPSLYNIDEKIDAIDINAKKTIWNTDLGLGLHYEHGALNDGLATEFFPGEGPPVEASRLMANQNTYNLFSATATGEKWIKQHVFVSAGGMFANLDNSFTGSQNFTPNTYNGFGYNNMTGSTHMQEYVMDVNLLTIPWRTLYVTPSVRADKETWNGSSTGVGTLGVFPAQPFNSQSTGDNIDVTEGLDLRYTGVTNWVFSAGGQWDETQGRLNQQGGYNQLIFGVPLATNYTDNSSLSQKYSVGANWYPLSRLAVDFGGYYKDDRYNYSSSPDSTSSGNTYTNYFTVQGYQTYDGNCRATIHLLPNLSLITLYEYQLSTIATTPSGGYSERETSWMQSQVIGQNISWVPWSRLSLEAGFTYVLSETKTPAEQDTALVNSQSTPSPASVLNAENNYWTLNFSPSVVIDDKTDLNLSYFYYQADDYQDNSAAGVPLGSGSSEHAVTATLVRRINPRLRLSLKYGYYNYKDALTGGNSNFEAHLIMATMQYRF
jgi:hypothetical protein